MVTPEEVLRDFAQNGVMSPARRSAIAQVLDDLGSARALARSFRSALKNYMDVSAEVEKSYRVAVKERDLARHENERLRALVEQHELAECRKRKEAEAEIERLRAAVEER